MNNIGERQSGDGSARHGKRCLHTAARPLSPSRIIRAKGRDTLLEVELKAMAEGAKDRDGDILNLNAERQKQRQEGKARAVGRGVDSQIFGSDEGPLPQPRLRIRPEMSDERMSALVSHDTRKDDAAARAANSEDMLTKMVHSSHPIPVQKEEKPHMHKKRFSVHEPPSGVAVAGFGGMGSKSTFQGPHGVATKPIESFVPDPKPASRFRGKRMIGNRPEEGSADANAGSGSYQLSAIF